LPVLIDAFCLFLRLLIPLTCSTRTVLIPNLFGPWFRNEENGDVPIGPTNQSSKSTIITQFCAFCESVHHCHEVNFHKVPKNSTYQTER
jgi:hypothetical protein